MLLEKNDGSSLLSDVVAQIKMAMETKQKNDPFPKELKQLVAKALAAGVTTAKIFQETGIKDASLYRWLVYRQRAYSKSLRKTHFCKVKIKDDTAANHKKKESTEIVKATFIFKNETRLEVPYSCISEEFLRWLGLQ